MVQCVKNLALSLQWLGLLLWCGFDPWPKNFHMPQAQPEKESERVRERAPIKLKSVWSTITQNMKCKLVIWPNRKEPALLAQNTQVEGIQN